MKSILFPPDTMSDAIGLGFLEEVTAEFLSMISYSELVSGYQVFIP